MKWRNRKSQLSDELARLSGLEPHEFLNVGLDATVDEIKSAYRKKAKIYHPDKADPFMREYNEQVMKLANDAYKRLMDKV